MDCVRGATVRNHHAVGFGKSAKDTAGSQAAAKIGIIRKTPIPLYLTCSIQAGDDCSFRNPRIEADLGRKE